MHKDIIPIYLKEMLNDNERTLNGLKFQKEYYYSIASNQELSSQTRYNAHYLMLNIDNAIEYLEDHIVSIDSYIKWSEKNATDN